MSFFKRHLQYIIFLLILLCSTATSTRAQSFFSNTKEALGSSSAFIENKGQYGSTYKGQAQMDSILFGYEGLGMPILQKKDWYMYREK
jgi:hypothetical protein